MSNLLRVRSGPFKIKDSWTLEEIEEAVRELNYAFLQPLTSGIDLPRVFLSATRANAFRHGLPTNRGLVQTPTEGHEPYVQVLEDGKLIGIGAWRGEDLSHTRFLDEVSI